MNDTYIAKYSNLIVFVSRQVSIYLKPPKKFPDFERMTQRLLSGEVLEQVGKMEALDSLIPDAQTNQA